MSAQPGAGWGCTGSRCCGCRPACGWRSPRGWSAAQRAVPRTHTAIALQYPPENKGQVTAHSRSSLRKPPAPGYRHGKPLAKGRRSLLAAPPAGGPPVFCSWGSSHRSLAQGWRLVRSGSPHIKGSGNLREHLPPQVAQGLTQRGFWASCVHPRSGQTVPMAETAPGPSVLSSSPVTAGMWTLV